MRSLYYRLEGETPVPCRLEEADHCQVADDTINGVRISTVFLGVNHSFRDKGPPILFETMLFGGKWDQQVCERHVTWDEAEACHRRWCATVRDATTPVSRGWRLTVKWWRG